MSFTTNEYALLYKGAATELLTKGRLTSNFGGSSKVDLEGSLRNYREIKLYRLDYSKVGLLDYEGAYDTVDLSGSWQTHSLKFDRNMKFDFDKLEREFDGDKGAISIETILQEAIKLKAIPEIDASVYEKINSVITSTNRITTVPTVDNIYNQIRDAIALLEDNDVPISDMELSVSSEVYSLIEQWAEKNSKMLTYMEVVNARGVNSRVPSINDVPIKKVPRDRFFPKIKRFTKSEYAADKSQVGYKGLGGAPMNWLLVPKSFVNPIIKMTDIKIKLDSIDNVIDRNHKAAYNIYYDTIIEEQLEQYFIGNAVDPTTVTVSGSTPVASLNDTKTTDK